MKQFTPANIRLLKLLAANSPDLSDDTTADALEVLVWGFLRDMEDELQLAWISDLCNRLDIETETLSRDISELRQWTMKPPN